MLALEVLEGPDRGRRSPLPPGEPQLIGRSSEAIPLTDTTVSRRHAELTPDEDRWLIRDLASTHGTTVNDRALHGRSELRVGDTIRCGGTRLHLVELSELVAGPAATPARRPPPGPAIPNDLKHCQRALELIWSAACQPTRDSQHHTPEPSLQAVVELAVWLRETITLADRASEQARLAAMGETIAIVSHAIKNILQGLQGGAGAIELALERGDLDLARQGWPILSRNLDRIHDLTFNMLAWSRAGHLDIAPRSLQHLIDEVVALQRPICNAKRVDISTSDSPLEDVPFDAGALHQAILNLVVNAVEAAPARRGTVRIETRRSSDGLEAVIAVTDNGPGVPEAVRAEIFEPFSSSRGQRGTGLGLAVTRQIIDAHGGSISLRSGADEGACFELRLPMHASSSDPGETDVPPIAPPSTERFES